MTRIELYVTMPVEDPMTNRSVKRPPATARNKMMDLLARRDHSEKELRQKLKLRFSAEEIDAAIEYGKTHGWVPSSEEGQALLAEKNAAVLHRKSKGIQYINHQLRKKGLPPVESDPALELEKALALVKNKYSVNSDLSHEEKAKLKAKMGRFLVSRGFDLETVTQTIRKVIYEKF
jgi:regulatory protein